MSLPLHFELTEADQDFIVAELQRALAAASEAR